MGNLAKLTKEKERLEEQFFEKAEAEQIEKFDQQFDREAFEFRGRMGAVFSIKNSLTSKLIEAVGIVEERKYWRVWGYKSLADWLQSEDIEELSKSKYYREKKLLSHESAPVFDCFNDKKIPRRIRLLLAENKAPIEYDGESVRIGDFIAPAGDSNAIIAIADAYNSAFHDLRSERDKAIKERDSEKEKNRIGEAENERLSRQLDEIDETTRFERALMNAVNGQLLLAEAIGELDDDEKKRRGPEDLKLFAQQYFKLSDAYGVKRSLTAAVPAGDSLVEKAIAEMAEDGSFEDLD